jgi:hypothetical protein
MYVCMYVCMYVRTYVTHEFYFRGMIYHGLVHHLRGAQDRDSSLPCCVCVCARARACTYICVCQRKKKKKESPDMGKPTDKAYFREGKRMARLG